MKLIFTCYFALMINSLSGQSYLYEVNAVLTDMSFDIENKEFTVRYDILQADDDDLFLIEFHYQEFFSLRKITPVAGSVTGDADEFAVKGGSGKEFVWKFGMQPETSLEVGEFKIDVIQIKKEESRKLLRLYKKQYRIRSKLERENLKSRKRKRLLRKLAKIRYKREAENIRRN